MCRIGRGIPIVNGCSDDGRLSVETIVCLMYDMGTFPRGGLQNLL